jgi:hypothetical protein
LCTVPDFGAPHWLSWPNDFGGGRAAATSSLRTMAAWGARPARFCNKGETWAYHGADYPEAGCGAG